MEDTAPPLDDSDDDEPSTSTSTSSTTSSPSNPNEGKKINIKRNKRQASLLYPKWKDNTLYYYVDSSISGLPFTFQKGKH